MGNPHSVFWRYRNDVTFAVIGEKSFVWASTPVKHWFPFVGNPTNYELELTKFIAESIRAVDPELRCLSSICAFPSKPLIAGTLFKVVVDDDFLKA